MRVTNKLMIVLAFFLAVAGTVHGEDEMYFRDNESNVGMTIFRCGKVYMAYPNSQKKWERLHLAPRGLDLNDGEFAYAVTDIVRAYGGFAGLTGELHVLRVNESQPVSFEDMLSSGKIEAYDTAQYRFWGLRVLKTKNGAYLAFNDNYKGNYRLYKDGNFVGAYKTTFDLKRAAGLGFLKDQSVTLEDNGGDEFYVFRLGKTYIAQARNRYSGFSKCAPMLNRNLGNEPEFFSLQDGEVAEFKTRAFKVNGGKKKFNNIPMFTDSVEHFKKLSYDVFIRHFHMNHWEEGASQDEAEFRQYYDNGNQFLILYLDKKYWVYREILAEKKREFVGKFRKASDVDKALRRR